MWLKELPTGILALIFNDENSWAVIELYKCGDTRLNSQFRKGGITEVVLVHNYLRTLGRWPRCLKEFRLEKLEIQQISGLCTTPTLRNELKQLHRGLKSLSVTCSDALLAFFGELSPPIKNEPDSDEEVLERPSKRMKLLENDIGERQHAEMWNLNTTFPELIELRVFKYKDARSYVSRDRFPSIVISSLPRNLRLFEAEAVIPITDFGLLPSDLHTLNLSRGSIADDALPRIPPSITNLGASLDILQILKLVALHPSWLSMQTSPVHFFGEYRLPIPVFEQSSMYLNNMPLLGMQLRPSSHGFNPPTHHGRHLSIEVSYAGFYLTSQWKWISTLLPRSLTSLEIDFADWSGIEASMWPSTLVTLRTSDSFAPEHFHRLPRSLICFMALHLTLIMRVMLNLVCLVQLPHSLSSLLTVVHRLRPWTKIFGNN